MANRIITKHKSTTGAPAAGDLVEGELAINTADQKLYSKDSTTVFEIAPEYSHPTHPGDDAAVDTGALTGATVISDLDFNITTDTLGHVTDANATVSTRAMSINDLGGPYTNNAGTVTSVSGTGTVSGLTLTGTVTSSGNLTLGGAITGFDNYSSWTVRADSGADQVISSAEVLDLTGGTDIATSNAAGTLTINHSDTSALSGQQGSAGVSSVTVDGRGHVTAVGTATYLTSYSETDTLASVTGRGATTATASTFSGGLNMSDSDLNRPVLEDYAVKHQTPTVSANAVTVNCTLGNSVAIDMDPATAAVTLTLSNPPASGRYGEVTLEIIMGTPAYGIIWPGSITWLNGGSAPTLSSTDNEVDFVHLSTRDGGTNWYGTYALAAGASGYTHPTHPGDDFSVDTTALSGATVVSDIDINVTTDTLGHVTDANGVVSTREMSINDLGGPYTNNAGTVTSVGTNTGLSGTVTTSGNLSLNLPALALGGTLVGTDWLIASNGGVQNRQVISSIPLSIFNNNSGWTSNAGTVTSVGGTGTVSGLTLTGTVTGSGNLTLGGAITGFATTFDSLTSKTGGTGNYTTTGDMTADNFEATGLGPNSTPGTDDLYVGGYGILGSRTNSVYVSNAAGPVALNHGGVHGSGNTKLATTSGGVTITGTITASGNINANGNIVGDGATTITGIEQIVVDATADIRKTSHGCYLYHQSTAYDNDQNGGITFSTSAASGGTTGDIWFRYV